MFADALKEAVLFCVFLMGFPVVLWAIWAGIDRAVKRWRRGR